MLPIDKKLWWFNSRDVQTKIFNCDFNVSNHRRTSLKFFPTLAFSPSRAIEVACKRVYLVDSR